MTPARRLRRPAPAPLSAIICALALGAAFLEKLPSSRGQSGAGYWYSDISHLWTARDLASHALPYIHGGISSAAMSSPGASPFSGHEIEYPVLTGLFVWLTTLPVRSLAAYFLVSVLALAPFAVLAAWLLGRMVGRRALLFAAAPTLVWHSFTNWDLPVVAVAVTAVYAWHRNRFLWASALLAAGGSLKLWPAFLLLPLAVDLWTRGRRRQIAMSAGVAAAVTAAFNAPFMMANLAGWAAPFKFQSLRPDDVTANSLWAYVLPHAGVATVNLASAAACSLGFAIALTAGWWRWRKEAVFPFVQVATSMVMVFVALGKVHSPQYALWVLPFVALLRLRLIWWLLFVISDAWLFAQWSILLHEPNLQRSAVFLSDLVLLAMAGVALVSFDALRDRPPSRSTSGLAGPAEEFAVTPLSVEPELETVR